MGLFGRIRAWVEKKTQEDELMRLSDRQLRDAGISRYDVMNSKPKTKRVGS